MILAVVGHVICAVYLRVDVCGWSGSRKLKSLRSTSRSVSVDDGAEEEVEEEAWMKAVGGRRGEEGEGEGGEEGRDLQEASSFQRWTCFWTTVGAERRRNKDDDSPFRAFCVYSTWRQISIRSRNFCEPIHIIILNGQ